MSITQAKYRLASLQHILYGYVKNILLKHYKVSIILRLVVINQKSELITHSLRGIMDVLML